MKRSILHCDMNNFYASVECMLNPDLAKFPVAVCGNVEDRHGIVLAKNYMAKEFGVNTGDVVFEAQKKCKNLVIVPPHYEEYLKFSHLARKIYERYTDKVESYGMDECFLDISDLTLCEKSVLEIAHEIRKTVKNELKLTISVGVSFNKAFAKLGSDMKKPDAVTFISETSYESEIFHMKVEELIGVGKATSKILHSLNIFTIGDLAKSDVKILKAKLGKNGLTLHKFANGLDTSSVRRKDAYVPIKSIAHGVTTVEDLENLQQVKLLIMELSEKIAYKLNLHKKCATGICIHIKGSDLVKNQFQTKLNVPIFSQKEIAKEAFELFRKKYNWKNNVRSITVQAIDLVDENMPFQVDFSMNLSSFDKDIKLNKALLDIKNRFGKNAIKSLSLYQDLKLPKIQSNIIMPTGVFM